MAGNTSGSTSAGTPKDSSPSSPPKPWIIGHRGASQAYQENTIAAFVGAREQGAAGIELDIRRSADDVLIVHHDAHLPDGRMVREVQTDDLPEWVPTLAEALEAATDLWVNIEVKNHPTDPDFDAEHGISVAVAGLVAAFEMTDRVLVSSFDMDSIQRIRETDPTIPIGWLVWGQTDPMQLIARAAARGCSSINAANVVVDAGFVRRANEAGLEVFVWTVDDADRIRELASFGVDGIITNTPDLAIEALATRSSS